MRYVNYVVLFVENTYHVTTVLLFFLVFELDIPYADDVFLRKYILGDRARDGESVWDFGWVTVVMPQTKCLRGFCIRSPAAGDAISTSCRSYAEHFVHEDTIHLHSKILCFQTLS